MTHENGVLGWHRSRSWRYTYLTTSEMDFFIFSTLVIFVPKESLSCHGYPREQACLCVRRSIRTRDTSRELTLICKKQGWV